MVIMGVVISLAITAIIVQHVLVAAVGATVQHTGTTLQPTRKTNFSQLIVPLPLLLKRFLKEHPITRIPPSFRLFERVIISLHMSCGCE